MPCDDIKVQETQEVHQETQEIQGSQENEVTAHEESALHEDVITEAAAAASSPKVSASGDSLIASPSQDFSPSLSTAGMQPIQQG